MPKASIPRRALENARSTDIIVLVMGCARAGKSTFINHLLRRIDNPRPPLVVDPDVLTAVTSELETVVFHRQIERLGLHFLQLQKEQRIVLVDTPGLPDSEDQEEYSVLQRIATWLRESLSTMTFGGIVYLHDISQDRDDGAKARRSLTRFRGLCPEATLDKVVLLTSKWGLQGSNRNFSKYEEELKAGQWGGMIPKAHLMRLSPDDEKEGPNRAWQVIRHTLWRLDIRLGQQCLGEVGGLRAELAKDGKLTPEEAIALSETLQAGLVLQKDVLDLLQTAADGDKAAEESIRAKEEGLRTLHQAMILNKSLFYAGLVPSFKRKMFAFNALVIQ